MDQICDNHVYFDLNLNNFSPFEVVIRVSETQLQVTKKKKYYLRGWPENKRHKRHWSNDEPASPMVIQH